MTTATEPRTGPADHPAVRRLREHGHWLAPAGLVLLSFVVLFTRLSEPARIIFDETYYVEDARHFLVTGGVEESFAVHPPVGKWMIAGSIRLLGDTAFGWRAAGALAGSGIVLVTWLLGLRLFHRRWQALLACTLLLLDGLFVVQARTAMLDIFLALFTVLGAWLLVRDLQDLDAHAEAPDALAARPGRDRWLAGVAFGLAVATKWSGLLAIAVAAILVVGFELVARRRAFGTPWRRPGRLAWLLVGPLLLVPAATYAASYLPWLAAYEHTTEGRDDCAEQVADDPAVASEADCRHPMTARVRGLVREHVDIARFHRDLESTHAYRSDPYTWPLMIRPIAYYYEACDDGADVGECEVPPGTAAEVLALGNPALWWGWALLVPLLTGAMGRRNAAAWVVAGFHGGLFVPWLVVARPAFFFYMVPAVPFLALGTALAVGRLRDRPRDWVPWAAGGLVGLAAAVAVRVLGGTGTAAAIAFGTGWILAPLLATGAQEWSRLRLREPSLDGALPAWHAPRAPLGTSRVPAIVVGALLVTGAAVAFAWFHPLWYGIPIDADALRARWWLDTWI